MEDGTDIKPQIFDTSTGRVLSPSGPPIDPGETVTGATCALTGTPDDLKLVDVITTSKPAQGLQPEVDKTRAYAYEIGGTEPVASAEVTNAKDVSVAGTEAGVVIASGSGTTVLSNRDLSVLWTDPDSPSCVTAKVVVFQRSITDHNDDGGIEVRSPQGESVFKDPAVAFGCIDVLVDVSDQIIVFNHRDPANADQLVWAFFDADKRGYLDIDDVLKHFKSSGFTLSDGQLFAVETAEPSNTGMRVYDVKTMQVEFAMTHEKFIAAKILHAYFFGNHLYLVNFTEGTDHNYSVTTLPDRKEIGKRWTHRPVAKLNGWTAVLVGSDDASDNACAERSSSCTVELVKDQDGTYPGPWL